MGHPTDVSSAMTHEYLLSRLSYCIETGEFRWVTCMNYPVGSIAGRVVECGYRSIKLLGRTFFEHRLAWLYVTGSWPAQQIDHINGVKTDNRWKNLREATQAQNLQNRKPTIGSTGCAGTVKDDSMPGRKKKYRAMIRIEGVAKRKYLGHFATPEEAEAAYLAAKAELHPFQPTLRKS